MPNFLRNPTNDRSHAGLRLPFDLTTDSGESNIASNNSHLPDFLSDGHIFSPDCSSQSMPSTSSKNHVNESHDREERISVSMVSIRIPVIPFYETISVSFVTKYSSWNEIMEGYAKSYKSCAVHY